MKEKVPELSSVSQPKVPPVQVRTLLLVQAVRPAPLKDAVKRLDDEAVVEKRLVVVAEVPVAFRKVKFWRVEEEVTSRFLVVRSVVEAVMALRIVAKRLVEVA